MFSDAGPPSGPSTCMEGAPSSSGFVLVFLKPACDNFLLNTAPMLSSLFLLRTCFGGMSELSLSKLCSSSRILCLSALDKCTSPENTFWPGRTAPRGPVATKLGRLYDPIMLYCVGFTVEASDSSSDESLSGSSSASCAIAAAAIGEFALHEPNCDL